MRKFITIFLMVAAVLLCMEIVEASGYKLTTEEVLEMAKGIDEENAYILTALAERESSLRPWVSNGECLGMCQINPKWWQQEIEELGIDDVYDPEQSLMLANAILKKTDYPIELKLMLYNLRRNTAFDYWEQGKVTSYAVGIIKRAQDLKMNDFIERVNEIAVNSRSDEIIVMNQESYELCKPLDIKVLIDEELELMEWKHYKIVY